MSIQKIIFIILLFHSQVSKADISLEIDLSTFPRKQTIKPVVASKEFSLKLILKNTSRHLISSIKGETTCGCTTLNIPLKKIPAMKQVDAVLISDIEKERGLVTKTLIFKFEQNDVIRTFEQEVTFFVIGYVKEHEMRSPKNKITDKACVGCHVHPGVGKLGKELYQSVCWQCHGKNKQGATAMGFTNLNYSENFDDHKVFKLISKGNRSQTMPAFAEFPFYYSKDQIQSLKEYLKK